MSSSRRRAVLVVLALLGVGACSMNSSGPTIKPQQLSDLCANDACTTIGSARQTTGLTSDTIGYQLGPGAGTLLVPAPSGLSVLVRGHGVFEAAGVQHNVPSDYAWIDLPDNSSSPGQFSVADDGSVLHIADLRTTTYPACSVAPAGPR